MTDNTPRQTDNVHVYVGSEYAQLTDPATGQVHVLNPSAFAIWELCDGHTAIEAIVEAVTEVTAVPRQDVDRQVRTTVETLKEKGLVG